MNRRIVTLSALLTLVSLPGCVFFANDDWKNSYGTPELFLDNITDHWCYIYMKDDREGRGEDNNFEVKNALLEASPFVATDKTSSTSDRYFTYENYISPSTAGPNYCTLAVYSDGFMRIDHKSALGPHQFAYFSMDAEKASSIIDLVEAKIPREKKMAEEDLSQAKIDGTIERFIEAMEKKASVYTSCVELVGERWEYHEFYDKGEVLDLIKSTEFTLTDGYFVSSQSFLTYNAPSPRSSENDLKWTFDLASEGDLASIHYEYKERIGKKSEISFTYSLNADKGKEILAKALELVKK